MMKNTQRTIASLVLIAMVGVNAPLFGVAAQTTTVIVDGDLIKTVDNPDVYIVKIVGTKEFKRLILTPDIFNTYGHLNWGNIKTVSAANMARYSISGLVRAVGDPKVYQLTSAPGADTGKKNWLNMTAAEFQAEGYDWDSIYTINTSERDLYEVGYEIGVGGKGGEVLEKGVTVALSSTTPPAEALAKNASDAVFTKIDLKASENTAITSIAVARNGIASNADISEVKLFDGASQLGGVASLNNTTNKAVFTGLHWALNAGVAKTLTIAASISSSATTGSAPKFGIVKSSDITLSSNLPVLGAFPISGNTMTIAGISTGRLDVTARTVPQDMQPVAGSIDQEIASWTFEAVSEGITIKKIVLTQTGSAANNDIKNIKLKINGQQITKTLAALSLSGTAVFDLSSDPLVINAGASKIVYASTDIGAGTSIVNRKVKFEISNTTDVTVIGANSGAAITITTDEGGNGSTFVAQDGIAQTISQGSGFSATIYSALNPSAQFFVRGRTQELFSAFRFTAGSSEDMRIARVKLQLFGSGADAADISNVTLYKYDETSGQSAVIDSPANFFGTIATYGVSSTGLDKGILDLLKGSNAVVLVKADISNSATWTNIGIAVNEIKVDGVQSQTDIASSSVNISAVDATDGTEATRHNAQLNFGTLTLGVSPINPAVQNISPGTSNVTFGKFDLTATGEDITLSSLTVNLCDGAACVNDADGTAESGDFTNVKLLSGTTQLGATAASPVTYASFSFNLLIKKDTTVTLSVIADVPSDAVTLWASSKAGVAVDKDLTATGLSSNATVSDPSSDGVGNVMTAVAETLTIAFQNLPTTTLVKNASDAVIARLVITGGTAGDVRVSSIKFSADDTATLNSASDVNTLFGSLKLYAGNGEDIQLGTLMSAFTDSTPDTLTFSGLNLLIQKSTQKVLELRANTLATASARYVGIADLTLSGGTDVVGTGVLSNSTVYGTGATDALTSGAFTIASAGTLTVSVDAGTPSSKLVAVGASGLNDVEFARFKFNANTEAINLSGLKITLAQSNNSGSESDVPNFITVALYNGNILLATEYPSGSNSAGTQNVTFNFNNVLVERDGSVVLTLKANLNGTISGAKSMTTPNFTIADVSGIADLTASHVKAIGASSGVEVTVSAGAKDPSALSGTEPTNVNAMTIVKSKPVIELCAASNCSLASSSGSLIPGITEVIRFKISAQGDDVVFDGTNHNIRFTIAQSGGTATGRTARIFEVGKGTALQTISGIDLTSAGTINFSAITTTIAKNSSREFYVDVDLVDYASNGETFRLSLESATADLSWSDGVTTDISTTLTDGLPLTGGTFVK